MGRRSTQELAVRRTGELIEIVGDRAGELAERTGPLRDRMLDSAEDLAERTGPLVGSAAETVSGVLEDARERGGAAWVALRGDRVGPPVAVRRWPWALGAAVGGAAVGVAVAALMRKLAPADAPGAQEPHELRAVVDVPGAPSSSTTAPAHDGQPGEGRPTPAPPVPGGTFRL